MRPFGLFADAHLHLWSSFATHDREGRNSRLLYLLDEIKRVCFETASAGGTLVILAGDLFHVRGSIDPEVFNEVHRTFASILTRHSDMTILAIPGNHDLKGKEVSELGNAFQSLESISAFYVVTEPTVHVYQSRALKLLPWMPKFSDVMAQIDVGSEPFHDVICHVGINGVIAGMPDHGLNADDIAAKLMGPGNRLFAGHYHNHKVMADGKVISIGAIAHHTWSDVGSKAGFLLVWPDRFEYRASNAPSFIDIDASTDPDDYPMLVDGNYVRVRELPLTEAEVGKMRAELIAMKARGVIFEIPKQPVALRAPASTKSSTLEDSIDKFIDEVGFTRAAEIKRKSMDILTKVRAAVD